MKKWSFARNFLITLLFAAVILTGLPLLNAGMPSAAYAGTQGSDYVQVADSEIVTETANLPDGKTRVRMADDALLSRLVFGETTQNAQKDYAVDMTRFSFKFTIEQLNSVGRFTISFVKDRTAAPYTGSGAEGISVVFRADGNSLALSIKDTKTGELIEEMKGFPFAYQGGESDNWKDGHLGFLSAGGFLNKTVTVAFADESVNQSGGVTMRPAISGGNDLGTTIPAGVFASRGLDRKNIVFMFSAGEGTVNYNFSSGAGKEAGSAADRGSDMQFVFDAMGDRNTLNYNTSVERGTVVSAVNSYVTSAGKAQNGQLTYAEYTAALSARESISLTALRSRDRFTYGGLLDEADALIAQLQANLEQVKTAAEEYLTALNELSDLGAVTQEKITAASEKKENFYAKKIFIAYLSAAELSEVNAVIEQTDERLLLRAQIHLQIKAYEAAVADFNATVTETPLSVIKIAEETGHVIDKSLISMLAAADQTAFNNRITAADNTVKSARSGREYAYEEYKINAYDVLVSQLTAANTAEEMQAVYLKRPVLLTDGITPIDRETLRGLLTAADNKIGAAANGRLANMLNSYSLYTNALKNLTGITEAKINIAKNNRYDAAEYDALVMLAGAVNYSITAVTADITEADRLVAAAEIKILSVLYSGSVQSGLTSAAALDAAFTLREAALEAGYPAETLTGEEITALEQLNAESDALLKAAALNVTESMVAAYEAAIENGLGTTASVTDAKAAKAALPDLKYLLDENVIAEYQERIGAANDVLFAEDLYYFSARTESSWTAESVENGVKISGKADDGIMSIQDPININGFDMVFEFTKIGRIWKGEDPIGSGKQPQNIPVINIMRDFGTYKDGSQGFSIYLYANVLNELEVMIYGCARDGQEVQLASGKVLGLNITGEPYEPFDIRIRVSKRGAPYNCYEVWVNSLCLNVYYRDFINVDDDKPAYIAEYGVGDEIGENIYKNDLAYVSFILFGDSLAEEEKTCEFTVKMLGGKTFAGYVAPLYLKEVEILQNPAKLTYTVGETFVIDGLIFQKTMSDGSKSAVPNGLLKIQGNRFTSKGEKKVTISYTEDGITFSKVVTVTVTEAPAEPESLPGWAIALIAVGSVIVLGGAALAVVLILKKKKASKA